MIIEFDTDAMTVTVEGVDPIEVADISEALQVVEAAAGEMMSDDMEYAEGEEMSMEDEMPGEETETSMHSMGKGKGMMKNSKMKKKMSNDTMEEDAMMDGYK